MSDLANASRFVLEIEVGNDAMSSTDDIRNLLGQLAASDLPSAPDRLFMVRDINGNTVGHYRVEYHRTDIINLEEEVNSE